jgi:acyl-CoA thioesterase
MEKYNTEIIRLYEEANSFGDLLGMELTLIDRGIVEYRMKVSQNHLATPKAAHGGAIAALVDGALGVAALSQVSVDKKVVSTIEFKVNYLKPALIGDELVATGRVQSAGNRILYVECSVVNQHGEIISKANGTFNAYPASKAFGKEF